MTIYTVTAEVFLQVWGSPTDKLQVTFHKCLGNVASTKTDRTRTDYPAPHILHISLTGYQHFIALATCEFSIILGTVAYFNCLLIPMPHVDKSCLCIRSWCIISVTDYHVWHSAVQLWEWTTLVVISAEVAIWIQACCISCKKCTEWLREVASV